MSGKNVAVQNLNLLLMLFDIRFKLSKNNQMSYPTVSVVTSTLGGVPGWAGTSSETEGATGRDNGVVTGDMPLGGDVGPRPTPI